MQRIDGRVPSYVFNELVSLVKAIAYDGWPQLLLAAYNDAVRREDMYDHIATATSAAGILNRGFGSSQAMVKGSQTTSKPIRESQLGLAITHVDEACLASLEPRGSGNRANSIPWLNSECDSKQMVLIWATPAECSALFVATPRLYERVDEV